MASQKEEPEFQLIGTHTRYSSWTTRVETLLEYYQIPYKKTFIKLSEVKEHSESGLVPVLTARSLPAHTQITDSLSICEFLAESHPDLPLWPKDRYLRALARSAVAQMHSGFTAVRSTYHSNFIGKYTGNIPVSQDAKKEIERILAIWTNARRQTTVQLKALGKADDGFLFGKFGIADSFYWPVLWRFRTYNLPLTYATPEAVGWMKKKMWNDPTLKSLISDYFRQAEDPETIIPKYEDIFKTEYSDIEYGAFTEGWEFVEPK
ncbi:glutamine amidotransferase subunit pdxT [Blastomyces dermatitidis ER-3]|uniref:Glutamine amidotransferase subunit pdxT n=1 Tax=Ajellomyces dermatitidis (strain ER-3 / ATCC MYA-2586) TaxID=559297 RepID=A0ABP2EMS2_AJEDR|nr:glutamine amidotransferase subunit pdxT [Blastomyces dermatitidis ER-3]EEQ84354.1 glutamine amidotransferase subunit pdxT [Blastomyces dermatitidis ER-3]